MIKINDNYGFEADDLNYILMRKTYKRRKEQGTWVTTDEETWTIDGYYATLQQLVKDVTRKELRSTKFKDLDVVLKKVEELIQDANDEILTKYFVTPFYSEEDSQMDLTNCTATADFLAAYLQTDPKLDKIKREYEEKIKEIKNK